MSSLPVDPTIRPLARIRFQLDLQHTYDLAGLPWRDRADHANPDDEEAIAT